jgi:hypothetical protein
LATATLDNVFKPATSKGVDDVVCLRLLQLSRLLTMAVKLELTPGSTVS